MMKVQMVGGYKASLFLYPHIMQYQCFLIQYSWYIFVSASCCYHRNERNERTIGILGSICLSCVWYITYICIYLYMYYLIQSSEYPKSNVCMWMFFAFTGLPVRRVYSTALMHALNQHPYPQTGWVVYIQTCIYMYVCIYTVYIERYMYICTYIHLYIYSRLHWCTLWINTPIPKQGKCIISIENDLDNYMWDKLIHGQLKHV
jgi:hypothetical protein